MTMIKQAGLFWVIIILTLIVLYYFDFKNLIERIRWTQACIQTDALNNSTSSSTQNWIQPNDFTSSVLELNKALGLNFSEFIPGVDNSRETIRLKGTGTFNAVVKFLGVLFQKNAIGIHEFTMGTGKTSGCHFTFYAYSLGGWKNLNTDIKISIDPDPFVRAGLKKNFMFEDMPSPVQSHQYSIYQLKRLGHIKQKDKYWVVMQLPDGGNVIIEKGSRIGKEQFVVTSITDNKIIVAH